MASNIIEFFGYSPKDKTPEAVAARQNRWCPFQNRVCTKPLRNDDGTSQPNGVCTLKPRTSGPVICCPIRLYTNTHQILADVAATAFTSGISLVYAHNYNAGTGECIVVFGKGSGKELRLPSRAGGAGAYFVDWILAHVNAQGELQSFVAVEVQSIDTTGNYRQERAAYLREEDFTGASTAGFNWENVSKRILPQIIYKGHVLRQEPLCQKGLFFICPTPVYTKMSERLGGGLRPYSMQPGSLTMMWYDLGPEVPAGQIRVLEHVGTFTTTIDQVALAFTAPSNLPEPGVYEEAIRASLHAS